MIVGGSSSHTSLLEQFCTPTAAHKALLATPLWFSPAFRITGPLELKGRSTRTQNTHTRG